MVSTDKGAGQGGNVYLEKVVAEQAQLEGDLKSRRAGAADVAVPGAMAPAPAGPMQVHAKSRGKVVRSAAPLALGADQAVAAPGAVDVRISGFWRWKTVLVPSPSRPVSSYAPRRVGSPGSSGVACGMGALT